MLELKSWYLDHSDFAQLPGEHHGIQPEPFNCCLPCLHWWDLLHEPDGWHCCWQLLGEIQVLNIFMSFIFFLQKIFDLMFSFISRTIAICGIFFMCGHGLLTASDFPFQLTVARSAFLFLFPLFPKKKICGKWHIHILGVNQDVRLSVLQTKPYKPCGPNFSGFWDCHPWWS